jgi:hypothetical protein
LPEKERWISWTFLMKRWDVDVYGMYACIEEGLPCYDRDRTIFHWEDGCEKTPEHFKMDDVERFEVEHPYLFEYGNVSLDAKEKRELGQLRSEKEKWEASLKVAVEIGIYCREQDRRMTIGELDTKMRQIDKDIQDATIRRIRKAIPPKYKSKGGRPKKNK